MASGGAATSPVSSVPCKTLSKQLQSFVCFRPCRDIWRVTSSARCLRSQSLHIGGPLIIFLGQSPCIYFPRIASVFYILLIRSNEPESQLVFPHSQSTENSTQLHIQHTLCFNAKPHHIKNPEGCLRMLLLSEWKHRALLFHSSCWTRGHKEEV